MSKKCFVIAGPTASGKSGLSLQIAEKIPNSYIINADSRQIYNGLKVLTASPIIDDNISLNCFEDGKVGHYLYNYRALNDVITMYEYLIDVKKLVEKYPDKTPVFVGGTGMYLDALINGVHELPVRSLETKYDDWATEDCLIELGKIDTKYAQIVKDKRRAIRALDIYDQTGKTMTELVAEPKKKFLNCSFVKMYVDHDQLKERIRMRLEQNFEDMIEEVRKQYILVQNTPLQNAIGVSEIQEYLQKKNDKEKVLQKVFEKTWQYAKRQRTWFKKYYQADFNISVDCDLKTLFKTIEANQS